jgi:FKBP-type peptidyl-prolyl cis-trans isomerase FkpA
MSVTAVPIPPVEKGSLLKLWGGLALAVAIAGGVAWAGTGGGGAASGGCKTVTASGLGISTVKPGKGAKPTDTDVVLVNYKGRLASDGKEFDAGQRVPFPVSGLVPGFTEGLKEMQKGGSYKLCIPAALGYGAQATGPIPANSDLIFDVDLIEFKSMAEIQAMQQQMQQQGQIPGQGGADATPQGTPK